MITPSNYQKYQVSKEKCNTFRLPEAATELFLHAEKWYFFQGDEKLGEGPCFTPTPHDKYNKDIKHILSNRKVIRNKDIINI